tara:strand:- start:703 stop:4827 length:4125 start_codon:yes stop_codon:yes gene_type:complete
MTTSTTTPRLSYTADGSTAAFTFNFEIADSSSIAVYEGATKKTLTTHYTVSFDSGTSGTGTVTFNSAPSSGTITLIRDTNLARTTDFENSGAFLASTVNTELDRLSQAVIDATDKIENRAISTVEPNTDTATLTIPAAADRANKVLSFDSSGNAQATTDGGGDVTQTGSQTLTNKTLTAPIINGAVTGNATYATTSTSADAFKTPTLKLSGADGTISAIGTNQGILLNTTGTGDVSASSDIIANGDLIATGRVRSDSLALGNNADNATLVGLRSNENITIDPAGTGTVELNANTNVTGTLATTGTITPGGNILLDGNKVTGGSTAAPSADGDLANKKYVDDSVGAVGSANAISQLNTSVTITDSGTGTITGAVDGSTLFTGTAASGFAVTGPITATTSISNDAISINDNTITTTRSNDNLILDAAGTGKIVLTGTTVAATIQSALTGNADLSLNASGSGDIEVNDNNIYNAGSITADAFNAITGVDWFGGFHANRSTAFRLNNTTTGDVITIDTTTSSGAGNDVKFTGNVNTYFSSDRPWTFSNSATFTGAGITVDNLTINDNIVSSSSNADIILDPGGTGDVKLGNFLFDADQSVGAGQDNYVLTYDNSSGKITLEESQGGVSLSGSTNNTITTVTGANALQGEANLTFDGSTLTVTGDQTISGNLTVNGSTTTVNTTNTAVADNIIELNSGISQSLNDAGIIIERGSTGDNAAIIWDESEDEFTLGTTTATAGDKSGGITVAAGNLKVATLEATQAVIDVIAINDNTITTNTSNANLELNANGSGIIDLMANVGSINAADLKIGAGGAGGGITNYNAGAGLNIGSIQGQTGAQTLYTHDGEIKNTLAANSDQWLLSSQTAGGGSFKILLPDTGPVLSPSTQGATTPATSQNFSIQSQGNGNIELDPAGTGDIVLDAITIHDNSISTNASNANLEINANGSGTVVLENLSIAGDGATVTGILDEDAMGTDSNVKLATQQSIKAYADTKATLSGSTNNQVATVTGAHALQGESGLTYDGSTLAVTGAATVSTTLGVTGDATLDGIIIHDNSIKTANSNANLEIGTQGTGVIELSTDDSSIFESTKYTDFFGGVDNIRGVVINTNQEVNANTTGRNYMNVINQDTKLVTASSSSNSNFRQRTMLVTNTTDLNGFSYTRSGFSRGPTALTFGSTVMNSGGSASTIKTVRGFDSQAGVYVSTAGNLASDATITDCFGANSTIYATDDSGSASGNATVTNGTSYRASYYLTSGHTFTNHYGYRYVGAEESAATNRYAFYSEDAAATSRMGAIRLDNQSGDPTHGADFSWIYAKDDSSSSEVHVKDEAGNVTKISPHNQAGEWEYYSKNTKTGKTVRVNMERMIKKLEEYTGESFIENE